MELTEELRGMRKAMKKRDIIPVIFARLPKLSGPLINSVETRDNLIFKYISNKLFEKIAE